MITTQQILTMLNLQDKMNAIVNPSWRTAGYNWLRAVMVEAVEAIDHAGWKWWKKQTPDIPQVKIELVDIWHFILSHLMVHSQGMNNEMLAQEIFKRIPIKDSLPEGVTLVDFLQSLVGSSADGQLDLHAFSAAMHRCDMTWDELYSSYIAKNVLNQFRQAHGYKTGEYIKDWSSVGLTQSLASERALEDNDHLHDIMQFLDPASEKYIEMLTTNLEHRYACVKEALKSN